MFRHARRMVEMDEDLSSEIKPYRHVLEHRPSGSVLRAISSEAYCVVPGTLIDMVDGTRRPVEDVAPGDGVVGHQEGLVLDHATATGTRPAGRLVTVTTHRGRSVTCTADHPFLVRSRDYHADDRHRWVAAEDLSVGDRVVVAMGWPGGGEPLGDGEAWALGAWVGDGCNTKFTFTNIDPEIIGALDSFLATIGSGLRADSPKTHRVVGSGKGRHDPPGRRWVKKHCGRLTAADKRVPDSVMRGTPHDWAEFLSGLLDTDGSVPIPRPYVKWTSASRGLVDDCQSLLARLGFNGTVGAIRVGYRGEVRTYWELRVCGIGQLRRLARTLALRHPAKRARLDRALDHVDGRAPFRAWDSDRVVSVVDAGVGETVALSVGSGVHVTNGLVTHNTKEGLSPTLVLYDEPHAAPDRDLFDVLSLAMGARLDPLLLMVSTAGVMSTRQEDTSLFYGLYEYALSIIRGEVEDPTFAMVWWGGDETDDHLDEAVWARANPGLGDLLDIDDLRSAVRRTPEAEFRTKRLNIFTPVEDFWLPAGTWEKCQGEVRLDPRLPIAVGIDVAIVHDASAVVVAQMQGERVVVSGRYWLNPHPRDTRAHMEWRMPLDEIVAHLRDLKKRYPVSASKVDGVPIPGPAFVYDRYGLASTEVALEQERGWALIPIAQQGGQMVEASRRFYEAVLDGRIVHDGDPTLASHLRNVVPRQVGESGWRLEKASKLKKIDAAVAAVMAVSQALERPPRRPFRAFAA